MKRRRRWLCLSVRNQGPCFNFSDNSSHAGDYSTIKTTVRSFRRKKNFRNLNRALEYLSRTGALPCKHLQPWASIAPLKPKPRNRCRSRGQEGFLLSIFSFLKYLSFCGMMRMIRVANKHRLRSQKISGCGETPAPLRVSPEDSLQQ